MRIILRIRIRALGDSGVLIGESILVETVLSVEMCWREYELLDSEHGLIPTAIWLELDIAAAGKSLEGCVEL